MLPYLCYHRNVPDVLLSSSPWFSSAFQDDHFKGLTNLRHLILANNQLHSISPHAFDDFVTTLEDLDLSYNNLAQAPWETVGRLTNVNTLNMDHNLIENVPQGVFTNLHKLARYRAKSPESWVGLNHLEI